jgi:hypothetical protein
MKTTTIILCIFLIAFAAPLAGANDFELGLTLGYGFLINPPPYLAGVSDSSGGFQFEIKGQYLLFPDFLGGLSLGVLSGFMMCNRYTDSSEGKYGRGDIPLVAFGQLKFGPVYALAGFGVHFWTGDGVGTDFGMTYGGGYLFKLSDALALDLGLRLHTPFANNALMLNCSFGAVISF